MAKLRDKILDNNSPNKQTKRKIRKYTLKKMGGATRKERFTNFFTNREGYYSWKEMMINYLIVISLLAMLITGIFSLVNWRWFQLETLMTNPLFDVLVITVSLVIVFLFMKRKQRKRRFECYINNGVSNKYVFWKDDISNPKNRPRHRSFD